MKILIPDNVSTKTNVFDILKERGFIEQCTHEDEIRDMLGYEKIKFYIGFDPTAHRAFHADYNNALHAKVRSYSCCFNRWRYGDGRRSFRQNRYAPIHDT